MAEIRGQLISRKYRLLSMLGEGAMGVVYRAEQLDAEGQPLREVALKMVQPGFSRDPGFAQRFLREVRVAAKLRSPHTVTVHDTGQSEEGQLYYAMELVQGPTLKEILQRHSPLPVERVVRIVGQICEALAEAHSLAEPVVHRDLKPANLFVETRQGQDWVKVGDFGIAKVLGEHTSGLTHTGASPGTPRYMAPEQWWGKEVDGRADLYAVGVLLYELLTGKTPFAGDEGPLALMYQHLHEAPAALPESIPVGIRFQVERLLAKTPQERPSNALQVRQALAMALSGEDERSTIVLEENRRAAVAVTDLATGTGRSPLVVEQETLAPRTFAQPATVMQPQSRAESTRGRARGSSRWVYGVAGSLLVLGLVSGGLWYRSQQRTEEARAQPAVGQGTSEPQPLQAGARQATPPQSEKPGEREWGQREEVAAEQPSQEQQLQQQAEIEQPKSAEDVQRKEEERKRAEVAQRLAELPERARQQRVAKRLIAPAGDNAVETYQELLQIAPGHEEAVAGLNGIKGQYRQWAEEAQLRGEWAKAQGHYETALKIDPQDETLTATLQQVQDARTEATALAGWYKTTVETPVLKDPRKGAAGHQALVYAEAGVCGRGGGGLLVESKRGNPPGYVARKAVTPTQEKLETTGATQQSALERPTTKTEMSQTAAILEPEVLMSTSLGDIKIELYEKAAPETVKNFLSYVNDKFYNGTIFHRVIANFMIQGGEFTAGMQQKPTKPPIRNEASNGLKNDKYTIAMARTSNPDSATSQFFINVKNNDFLNRGKAQDGVGSAVFGKVIEGIDVVHKIERVQTGRRGVHSDAPVEPVVIKSVVMLSPVADKR